MRTRETSPDLCDLVRTHLPAGFSALLNITPDDDSGPPWKEFDGHGEVRCVTHAYGIPEGWRHLHTNRFQVWIYNWAGALAQAKAEGWGTSRKLLPLPGNKRVTRAQVREAAVQADMDHMRGYLDGSWSYVGVVVKIRDADGVEVGEDSLWGVENSDVVWLKETVAEVFTNAAWDYMEPRRLQRWRAALHEARQRRYWASRDVVTRA